MPRYDILYSNETKIDVNSFKFSIFNSFEEIEIRIYIRFFRHKLTEFFPKQLSLNGRYFKKDIFNNFQILHTASTHFDGSISEKSLKVFSKSFVSIVPGQN
jgi:hypothetical protein